MSNWPLGFEGYFLFENRRSRVTDVGSRWVTDVADLTDGWFYACFKFGDRRFSN
ncbi:MAG: hypothetical protein F6J93_25995 [Oscillatoria sp. SIO1A7]|nr:hypothetical protein [Oscillatoria sp. SIO1A7]